MTETAAHPQSRRVLTKSATVLGLSAYLLTAFGGAAMAADPTEGSTDAPQPPAAGSTTDTAVPNSDELTKAAEDATKAGVKITKNPAKTIVADAGEETDKAVADATAANAAEIAKLKEVTQKQQAAVTEYQQKKTAYDTAKAAYDKTINEQIKDADPNKAIIIGDTLAYSQPFELTKNRSTLDLGSITGANGASKVQTLDLTKSGASTIKNSKGQTIKGYNVARYNSDKAVTFDVTDGSSVTATWKNVAKDIESGRPLDVTVKFDNFSTNSKYSRDYYTGNPHIDVYSNFIDSISTEGIFNVDQTFTFKYADGKKELYDKNFYINAGSLNAQAVDANRNTAAQRYEYAAPGNKTISAFLPKGSLIKPDAQKVNGTAAKSTQKAYMVEQGKSQGGGISDSDAADSGALKKIGVSFLIENGGNIAFGVTGNAGVNNGDPRSVPGHVESLTNHIMTATTPIAATIKAPVLPKPPAPLAASYTPTVVTARGPADLQLNKFGVSVSDDNASHRSITYGFQVKNAGGSAAKTPLITDTFGEGLIKDSIMWSSTPEGNTVPKNTTISEDKTAVTLPDTAAGDTQMVYATVKLEDGYVAKDATNGAKVTSPSDPKAGKTCEQPAVVSVDEDTDGCDTVTVPIPKSNLKIHKVFGDDNKPVPGAETNFNIAATNAGAGNAGSVNISDAAGEGIDKDSIKITDVKVVNPGTPAKYAEKIDDKTVDFSTDGTVTVPTDPGAGDNTGPVQPDTTASPSPAAPRAAAAAEDGAENSTETPSPMATDGENAGTVDGKAPEFTIEGNSVKFTNLNPGAEVSIAVTAKYAAELSPDTEVQNKAMITSPDDPEKGKDNGKTNEDLPSDDDGYDAVTKKTDPAPEPSATETEKPAPPAPSPSDPEPSPEPTETTPAPVPDKPEAPADPKPADPKPVTPPQETLIETGFAAQNDDGDVAPTPLGYAALATAVAALGGLGYGGYRLIRKNHAQ